MSFVQNVGERFGLRIGKKAESPDDDLAHVTSEVSSWKALVNR